MFLIHLDLIVGITKLIFSVNNIPYESSFNDSKNFNKELLDELMELDIQYGIMKDMYETQLEALNAERESLELPQSASVLPFQSCTVVAQSSQF